MTAIPHSPSRRHLDTRTFADHMVAALEAIKADHIQLLDVQGLTSVCDYILIGSGRSSRQVRAMADRVIEEAGRFGRKPLGTEGYETGEWVLVDLGDVVIHTMHPMTRAFYQLEKLWGDAATTHGTATAQA